MNDDALDFYWYRAMIALHGLQGNLSEDDMGMRTADDESLGGWLDNLSNRIGHSGPKMDAFENAMGDYRCVLSNPGPTEKRQILIEIATSHALIVREFSRELADELAATLPEIVWAKMCCEAWHNDTCVRFNGTINGKHAILWCDYADEGKREDDTNARFTLQMDADEEALDCGEAETELTTDNPADVAAWLNGEI